MTVRIDFHVHSNMSLDGTMSRELVARMAGRKRLDAVAITDHGVFTPPRKFLGVKIIGGEEISSDMGHLMGIFIEEPVRSRDFFEACDEIRSQGGLSVLPHPFRMHRNPRALARHVDVIEVFNARTPPEPNRQASALAKRCGLPGVVGSDAHFAFEIGNAVTRVETDDLEGARKLLLRGKAKFSCRSAPLFVHPATWVVKGLNCLRRRSGRTKL